SAWDDTERGEVGRTPGAAAPSRYFRRGGADGASSRGGGTRAHASRRAASSQGLHAAPAGWRQAVAMDAASVLVAAPHSRAQATLRAVVAKAMPPGGPIPRGSRTITG